MPGRRLPRRRIGADHHPMTVLRCRPERCSSHRKHPMVQGVGDLRCPTMGNTPVALIANKALKFQLVLSEPCSSARLWHRVSSRLLAVVSRPLRCLLDATQRLRPDGVSRKPQRPVGKRHGSVRQQVRPQACAMPRVRRGRGRPSATRGNAWRGQAQFVGQRNWRTTALKAVNLRSAMARRTASGELQREEGSALPPDRPPAPEADP